MKVSKLTLMPLISNGKKQVFKNPTTQEAIDLVSQKLSMNVRDGKTARIFRKLPENLKGWVNPQTKVSTERKFIMDM